MSAAPHISRWDLDKTYLRTEFDTFMDLVRTAFERADEKRTHPGAATLLRELAHSGVSIHILSGSPEQMRHRLEAKLRLDGITWDSFTLKPNLKNLLRLRFRALRDQLGYKLPALLQARATLSDSPVKETLFGDDAEADAFIYSFYADVIEGNISKDVIRTVAERGRVYEDVADQIVQLAPNDPHPQTVERILIHLEQQTPPGDFDVYGPRVVPFYNYLQSAFVVYEDGRLPALGVLRVASELVTEHRFTGDALARSYYELGKRGHLRGAAVTNLRDALTVWRQGDRVPAAGELSAMIEGIETYAEHAARAYESRSTAPPPDYIGLVTNHNARRK